MQTLAISHSCLSLQDLRVIAICKYLDFALPRQFARVARSHGCGEHCKFAGYNITASRQRTDKYQRLMPQELYSETGIPVGVNAKLTSKQAYL